MTLSKLDPQFVEKGYLCLNDWQDAYNIDTPVVTLCRVNMGERLDSGTPKDINAYHRGLKIALQEHQKTIFGTRDNPSILQTEAMSSGPPTNRKW